MEVRSRCSRLQWYYLSLVLRGLLPMDLVFEVWLLGFGLFFPKGFYILTFPVAFRVLGSSILGNAINGDTALNPLFASVLIPLVLWRYCWDILAGRVCMWFLVV